MPFELIGKSRDLGGIVRLRYGERGDTTPFVLTVKPGYVAHAMSKAMPLANKDVDAYINQHADELKAIAEDRKGRGLSAFVLE